MIDPVYFFVTKPIEIRGARPRFFRSSCLLQYARPHNISLNRLTCGLGFIE